MRYGRHVVVLAALSAGCETDPAKDLGSLDEDNDGYDIDVDCDDTDPNVHPGAPEICADGIDNNCDGDSVTCDEDGDGWSNLDDCDDLDPEVHPGAYEICNNGIDDDCNDVATTCVDPDLIYTPTTAPSGDSWATVIEADRAVFTDPEATNTSGDTRGRAVAFLPSAGEVTEADADFVIDGPSDQDAAFGTWASAPLVLGTGPTYTCINADAYDTDGSTPGGGKAWCFDWLGDTTDLSTAAYTVTGTDPALHVRVLQSGWWEPSRFDATGDGVGDLLVPTSVGVYVLEAPGGTFTGDYLVPDDASFLIGDCTADCGFGVAALDESFPGTRQWLAIAGPGGPADTVSIYELPVAPGDPPDATFVTPRTSTDPLLAISGFDLFAVGDSDHDRVAFVDPETGVESGSQYGTPGERFGAWLSDGGTNGLSVLIGAPLMTDPYDHVDRSGGAYSYTVWGELVTGIPQGPDFVFVAPDGFMDCGVRVAGDIVTDEVDNSQKNYVTVTCPGWGGAGYTFSTAALPLPPPLVLPPDVAPTGPYAYALRRSLVNAFWTHADWLASVAQTRAVTNGAGATTGWQLSRIAQASPLYRMGLRNGDVVQKVNNTTLSSPIVVNALAAALLPQVLANPARVTTVRVQRGAATLTFSYTVVP